VFGDTVFIKMKFNNNLPYLPICLISRGFTVKILYALLTVIGVSIRSYLQHKRLVSAPSTQQVQNLVFTHYTAFNWLFIIVTFNQLSDGDRIPSYK